jgi:hypothetical protein
VHPEHQASAVRGAVGPDAKGANFLRPGEDGLKDQLQRQPLGGIQFLNHFLRVFGHLAEGLLAVEVLAAGNEPDFGGFKIFHRTRLIHTKD